MQIKIPVSLGELIDKITILEIKQERISDPKKLENINRELALLAELASEVYQERIHGYRRALKAVNEQLWDIETFKRECERQNRFDQGFIEAARAVYKFNDRRAEIKREINLLLGSEIVEEKSY